MSSFLHSGKRLWRETSNTERLMLLAGGIGTLGITGLFLVPHLRSMDVIDIRCERPNPSSFVSCTKEPHTFLGAVQEPVQTYQDVLGVTHQLTTTTEFDQDDNVYYAHENWMTVKTRQGEFFFLEGSPTETLAEYGGRESSKEMLKFEKQISDFLYSSRDSQLNLRQDNRLRLGKLVYLFSILLIPVGVFMMFNRSRF